MTKPRRKWKESTKIAVFRWWFAGAVYFMIAWATPLGQGSFIDLVFFLGVAGGLGTVFIFDPIVYGMFDVTRAGRIVNKKYYERTVWQGAARKLMELFKNFTVNALVAATYTAGNLMLCAWAGAPEGTILWAGEPFGYATLYLIFYRLLSGIAGNVARACKGEAA